VGGFASRFARVPALITTKRSLGLYKNGRAVFSRLENIVNRWATVIVANSAAVRNDVLSRERVDASKVRVIYNGVDIRKEKPAVTWKRFMACAPGSPVVCLTANFFRYKGHQDFIKAATFVRGELPDVQFVFVGDGRERPAIEAAVRAADMGRNIHLLGRQPDAPSIMALSDIVALSSHEEGFPNVVLEAMAVGKPVVATAVGGVPELVGNGVTGYLVPPHAPRAMADALVRLLRDRPAAEEMGRRGRQRVERRFSMERMVRSYEDLYEEIMGERR
jgi:glycosyltransferase involved in cell wall biosynthesis